MVRSPHAHARIVRIDKRSGDAALVLTGEDMRRENLGELPCGAFPAEEGRRPTQPILAIGTVRHVGEAVALVVADTPARAADAAEAIEVEYEPLRAVTLEDAHDEDVSFVLERGDREAVESAFAGAAHVTKVEVR